MHPLDRLYQLDTYNKIIQSPKKFVIVQAPTGSGKSAWAGQMVIDRYRVITLTRTKALQGQYRDSYDFFALYGKGNYRCYNYQSNGKRGPVTWCDLCPLEDKEIYHAYCAGSCPYPIAKSDFLSSDGGSLNYTKFLLEASLSDQFGPDILILDEAHELSDIVTDYAGFTIQYDKIDVHNEGKESVSFGPMQPTEFEPGKSYPQPVCYIWAMEWLNSYLAYLSRREPDKEDKTAYRKWYNKVQRIKNTMNLMAVSPESWFVFSDEKEFICKPLTARFHFSGMFDKAGKIVLMSATIGKIDNFVRELGIEDYEYIEVPNIWPAALRKIEDLKGPRLTWRSSQEDKDAHVEIIMNRIGRCPDHWTGIILSPSKALSRDLSYRLTGRPVYIPQEGLGTEEIAEEWQSFCGDNRGAIGLFWSLWEGADLGYNQFCIVAKAPFVNFKDPYDKARFDFDPVAGMQRTANKMVQGFGRIRRGHDSHYGSAKAVCIADGNWTRLRNFISNDILESIK